MEIMRNRILLFALLFAFVACNKDNNSSGILIKGKISDSGTKGFGSKSAGAIPLSDAKKVFLVNLFHGGLNSAFVDIIDGSFSAGANIGMATALVFLDENNKYIGTLSTRGLNLLPLSNLSDGGNTAIDLADLTLVGTSIIPSHDPFGNEIIITDEEINRLKEIDGFFETLAKNIDADNDNVLDVLVDKQLFVKTRFWIHAYQWGLNGSSPEISDVDINTLDYALEVSGHKGFSTHNSVVLSGPEGNPYNDISTLVTNSSIDGGFYSVIERTGGLFNWGTYTLTIDGKNYTLNYSNIDARQNLLFVMPTLNTNSKGELVSVDLEYKLPDGTSIDPVNILTDVMIQLNDDDGRQYFDSPRLLNKDDNTEGCDCVNGLFSYTPDTPVDISSLKRLIIAYNDLLGNTYIVDWNK